MQPGHPSSRQWTMEESLLMFLMDEQVRRSGQEEETDKEAAAEPNSRQRKSTKKKKDFVKTSRERFFTKESNRLEEEADERLILYQQAVCSTDHEASPLHQHARRIISLDRRRSVTERCDGEIMETAALPTSPTFYCLGLLSLNLQLKLQSSNLVFRL